MDKDNYRKLTEALASVNPPHSEFYEIQLGRSGFSKYDNVYFTVLMTYPCTFHTPNSTVALVSTGTNLVLVLQLFDI